MRVASPEGRGTTPKLLDFGIAKVMGEDEVATTSQTATRSRRIAFSPWYASPEQVSHARSGPWTDVHALGLILTEMLTDCAPFTGATSTALFQ
jgi:serine/threonine-protein kinase